MFSRSRKSTKKLKTSSSGDDPYQVDDRVLFITEHKAVVRFVGSTQFADGTLYGIELMEGSGENDGSVDGVRYFECGDGKGLFVRGTRIGSHSFLRVGCRKKRATKSRCRKTYEVGSKVRVLFKKRTAVVRYVGGTQFADGKWYGIELLKGRGENDGSVDGVRYFECADGSGLFVTEKQITKKEIRKKKRAMKKIYTLRPGFDGEDSTDEDWYVEDTTAWHRHIKPEELIGKYEPVRELGRGSYGIVYMGKCIADSAPVPKGTMVAIKKMRGIFRTETGDSLLREIRVLNALGDYSGTVKLFDILAPMDPLHNSTLLLVYELFDCHLRMIFKTNQFFTTTHVQYILFQILQSVQFLHSAGIAHSSLKPEHIAIDENCTVKLRHFGEAKSLVNASVLIPAVLSYWLRTEANGLYLPPELWPVIVAFISTNVKVTKTVVATDEKAKKSLPKTEPITKEKMAKERMPHVRRLFRNLFQKKKTVAATGDEESEERTRKKRILKKSRRRRVVYHWYRAPERILQPQSEEFLRAEDIWAVGCIFAELLQMQRDNYPDPSWRGPLFPGQSCFPPPTVPFDYARMDQMLVIFNVIGTPKAEDIEKISDPIAKKYLYGLPKRKKMDLQKSYPGCHSQGIALLFALLRFDVCKRLTAAEALSHEYFDAVRDSCPSSERTPETGTCFDLDFESLGTEQLRGLLLEETAFFNQSIADSKTETSTSHPSDC